MPAVGWLPEDSLDLWSVRIVTDPVDPPQVTTQSNFDPTRLGNLMNPESTTFITYTEPFDV